MRLHKVQRCSHPSRQPLRIVAARRVKGTTQVAVSRTLIAKKGHEADVAGIAREILKWTAEEATHDSGKGIVAFDCVRDGWEDNTFHFWERYESTSAFGTHTSAPKMVELMEQLEPHLEGPIGVSLYAYENGRLGPVATCFGPKGEGGLDDATGASGAAGGASYTQTSRAFDLTKVDEHEEAARERALLASVGTQTTPAAGEEPSTHGVADDESEQQHQQEATKAADTKLKGRIPLPSPQHVVSAFVQLKDQVMGSLCRLLRH